MRRVHGRICREQDVNLHLHLQQLSEGDDFQNEWMFVESRPIEPGEHDVCPRGQTPIHSYFFLENKFNGNRTFVGSVSWTRESHSRGNDRLFRAYSGKRSTNIYKGKDDSGVQKFTVKAATTLVRRLPIVEHLNLPLTRNLDGRWEVSSVIYPKAESLLLGQTYSLWVKATYVRDRLTLTAL